MNIAGAPGAVRQFAAKTEIDVKHWRRTIICEITPKCKSSASMDGTWPVCGVLAF